MPRIRALKQATAAAAGMAIAVAAYGARFALVGIEAMMARSGTVGARFAQGGFLAEMTKREASQILSVRQSANPEKVKAQHKKVRAEPIPLFFNEREGKASCGLPALTNDD